MKGLLKIKKFLENDKSDEYILETTNKETGWIGCASFHTNGEEKIRVNEGDPFGSDDASYTYKEFIKKYNYVLKKEIEQIKPKTHYNVYTLLGRINSYYYDESKHRHVVVLSASNCYGDFTIPSYAFGKFSDDILKLLKKDALIGIRGFIGANSDGQLELYAEKFTILANKKDDKNEYI